MLKDIITREEWMDHIREDDARGRDVNDLKLATFGDPEHPETVRAAIVPTMTRLNSYLDFMKMLGQGFLAILLGCGTFVGIAKGVGWL